jgi:hypothetical protein
MGLSGNSASKTNVIMVAPAATGLTADNYSNAIATASNYATKKTIAAGSGVTQSGASYNSYPYFTWNEQTVAFATSTQIQTLLSEAGNSFELAFGTHATAVGVVYLVDDIILVGKPAAEDDPATTEVNEAYPGTDNFVVADFENSPSVSRIGTGAISAIVDLDLLATYTGKYGKVMFALSGGTGAIPGLQITIPGSDPAKAYNKLSFNYFALTESANNKTIAVKTGNTADAAKAAAGVTVTTGDASTWNPLNATVAINGETTSTNLFLALGLNDAPAGTIYLIDDITLHY